MFGGYYRKITFLDSYRFTLKALGDIALSLNEDECRLTRKNYPSEEEFKLLKRRGVYPYDYIDSLEN